MGLVFGITACGSMGELAKGLPGGEAVAAANEVKELKDKVESYKTKTVETQEKVSKTQGELDSLNTQEPSEERDAKIAELEGQLSIQQEELAKVEAKVKDYEEQVAELEKLTTSEGLMSGFSNPLDDFKDATAEIEANLEAAKSKEPASAKVDETTEVVEETASASEAISEDAAAIVE